MAKLNFTDHQIKALAAVAMNLAAVDGNFGEKEMEVYLTYLKKLADSTHSFERLCQLTEEGKTMGNETLNVIKNEYDKRQKQFAANLFNDTVCIEDKHDTNEVFAFMQVINTCRLPSPNGRGDLVEEGEDEDEWQIYPTFILMHYYNRDLQQVPGTSRFEFVPCTVELYQAGIKDGYNSLTDIYKERLHTDVISCPNDTSALEEKFKSVNLNNMFGDLANYRYGTAYEADEEWSPIVNIAFSEQTPEGYNEVMKMLRFAGIKERESCTLVVSDKSKDEPVIYGFTKKRQIREVFNALEDHFAYSLYLYQNQAYMKKVVMEWRQSIEKQINGLQYLYKHRIVKKQEQEPEEVVVEATIKNVKVDLNVPHGGEKKLRCTLDFDINGCKGEYCDYRAYFFKEGGEKIITEKKGYRATGGQLAVFNKFTPSYMRSTYTGMEFYVPMSLLPKKHLFRTIKCYFELYICNADTNRTLGPCVKCSFEVPGSF